MGYWTALLKHGTFMVIAALAVACGGSPADSVTEQELTAAINAFLQANPPATLNPLGVWAEQEVLLPQDLITAKLSLNRLKQEYPTLFALQDAGVLALEQVRTTRENVFGREEQLPGLHVALTDSGLAWYLPETGRLRYADATLEQILDVSKLDEHSLAVVARLKIGHLAPWTEHPAVSEAFPTMRDYLNPETPIQRTYTLEYNAQGWQVLSGGGLL